LHSKCSTNRYRCGLLLAICNGRNSKLSPRLLEALNSTPCARYDENFAGEGQIPILNGAKDDKEKVISRLDAALMTVIAMISDQANSRNPRLQTANFGILESIQFKCQSPVASDPKTMSQNAWGIRAGHRPRWRCLGFRVYDMLYQRLTGDWAPIRPRHPPRWRCLPRTGTGEIIS